MCSMSTEAPITKRDSYWDIVKAILIFLVIFGHVIQFLMYERNNDEGFWTDPIFKGIYLFHMPLFMLVSGYFAAKSVAQRSWHALPRYLQRLALPCVGMGIICLIVALLKHEHLPAYFYTGATILWFLIVILECLVCYLIMQLKQALWWRITMFLLPIPAALLIQKLPIIHLLFPHLCQFTYLWPIFVLGAYLSAKDFSQKRISWKWAFFLLLFILFFHFFHPTWYVYRQPLALNFTSLLVDSYRTVAAIAGCGAFLWIIKHLYPYIEKFTFIKKIGQATLALYVLQTFAFKAFSELTWITPDIHHHAAAFVVSIIILTLIYIFYLVTRRIPLISLLLYGEAHFKK